MAASERPDSRDSQTTSASTSILTSTFRSRTATSGANTKRPLMTDQPSARQKRLRFELDSTSTATRSRASTAADRHGSSSLPHRPRYQTSTRASTSASTASATSIASTTQTTSSHRNGSSGKSQGAYTTHNRTRPRTSTTYLTTGASSENAIICAVTESRGASPTVGLACVNLSTFQATLCQIVDSPMYVRTLQKLFTWSPNTVLYPSTLAESRMMMFLGAEIHPGIDLRNVDKRYFTENDGRDNLQQLALGDEMEPLKVVLEGKFYALCAFSGVGESLPRDGAKKGRLPVLTVLQVLEYLKRDGEYSFAPNSLRVSVEPSDGSMMIDLSTIRSLELIQNLHNAKSRDSLFGLLNETLTTMGSRLLRSWVLQPSTQAEVLAKRFDALEELTSQESIFVSIRNVLRGFVDIDSVLTNIVILPNERNIAQWQEQCINYVLILKDFVQRIAPVFEALASAASELLKQVSAACAPETYTNIVEMIGQVINADTSFSRKPLELRNQKLYAVRSGASDLLDVARTAHKETVDDVMNHCRELAESHEISLEVSFENSRGYYLKFPAHELEGRQLNSEVFINVCKNKSNVECQTMALMKMNGKLASSHNEVMLMSIGAVTDLVQRIRPEIGPLFKIADSIAMLDVLAALAHVATQHEYKRPMLRSMTAIRAARHPIKIRASRNKFIPNDVFAPSNARLQILTGCNMSGKSTYIRTIALLQVMAQIGSFVPAEHAEFAVRNQLFARVSTDDNISANVSTFAAEMREAAFILGHVDDKSLVIVDELGRGTSTTDGLAIAIAIAEELLKSGASVWFVTHFHELAKLLNNRPGVTNLHLAVNLETRDQMLMMYTIATGSVQETSYGISLARVASLPPGLTERAQEVASIIRRRKVQADDETLFGVQTRKQRVLLGLQDQLLWAKESSMNDTELTQWLSALQDEFVLRMDELVRAEERLERARANSGNTSGSVGSAADISTVTGNMSRSDSAGGRTDPADLGTNYMWGSDEETASMDLNGAEIPSMRHEARCRRAETVDSLASLLCRPRSSSKISKPDTSATDENVRQPVVSRSQYLRPQAQRLSKTSKEDADAKHDRTSSAPYLGLFDPTSPPPACSQAGALSNISHRGQGRVLPPVPLFRAMPKAAMEEPMAATAGPHSDLTSGQLAEDEGSLFEDLLADETSISGDSTRQATTRHQVQVSNESMLRSECRAGSGPMLPQSRNKGSHEYTRVKQEEANERTWADVATQSQSDGTLSSSRGALVWRGIEDPASCGGGQSEADTKISARDETSGDSSSEKVETMEALEDSDDWDCEESMQEQECSDDGLSAVPVAPEQKTDGASGSESGRGSWGEGEKDGSRRTYGGTMGKAWRSSDIWKIAATSSSRGG